MMSLHNQQRLYHKHRREIRAVQEESKAGARVTIEHLVEKFGWCRTRAHTVLQAMWLLDILKPEIPKEEAA